MTGDETAPHEALLSFDGMLGILSTPSDHVDVRPVGVVIVVGGPQTRVGSHRQFVLLARALARAGYPTLRFDYAGMGDSSGPMPDFERAGPDIGRACDVLLREVPNCGGIVLWGLCDGATAALFHALYNERVKAVIAANPWARGEQTRSTAIVSQHYGSRLRSPEFWKKLATGNIDLISSLREAAGHARRALRSRDAGDSLDESLPARVSRALQAIDRPVRLQISGNDLTAAEFELATRTCAERPGLGRLRLESADHTFSDPKDWEAVVADSIVFLESLRSCRTTPHESTFCDYT